MQASEAKLGYIRDVESVESVLDEQIHGAWADGKAPIGQLTQFLQAVHDRNLQQVEELGRLILEKEPKNALIKDLVLTMRQHDELYSSDEESSEIDDNSSDESCTDSDDENEANFNQDMRETKGTEDKTYI